MSDPLAAIWHEALSTVYTEIPNPEGELVNGIITRSMVIDYAVLAYCNTRSRVVVSDLGCGFSTRYTRLRPRAQTWTHVDLPEVLRARAALAPMSDREVALVRDLRVLDEETPLTPYSMANVLFILEGVLNHLPVEAARGLIELLVKTYAGATVLGTVMTPLGQEGLQTLSEALGTPFPAWAIQSTSELEPWLKPARIERTWLLGKVSSRLGLVRPLEGDQASGFVFQATL